MASSTVFVIFVAVSVAWLSIRALQDHRAALMLRHGLLNSAARLFSDAKITLARDSFPVLAGRLPDRRRVTIELIADTMVFRRLPQLWLKLTLSETAVRRRPSIGALARPTGAEFYSIVHDLPEWMTPPSTGSALLMRGDGRASAPQIASVSALFRSLFSDPSVKEATITSRGVRLVRQAAEGDRGAHLLLRQIRFPITEISQDLVLRAISEAEALSQVLHEECLVLDHATL
ncbi:hypothetical protein [Mesorhizobium sp. A623]